MLELTVKSFFHWVYQEAKYSENWLRTVHVSTSYLVIYDNCYAINYHLFEIK